MNRSFIIPTSKPNIFKNRETVRLIFNHERFNPLKVFIFNSRTGTRTGLEAGRESYIHDYLLLVIHYSESILSPANFIL